MSLGEAIGHLPISHEQKYVNVIFSLSFLLTAWNMCYTCSKAVVTKDDGAKRDKAHGSFMEVLGCYTVLGLHTFKLLSY